MQRTVISLTLAAVLLMPTAGMAAPRHQISPLSWWETFVTWVVQVTGIEKSTTTAVGPPATNSPPLDVPDARSIIDPNGLDGGSS